MLFLTSAEVEAAQVIPKPSSEVLLFAKYSKNRGTDRFFECQDLSHKARKVQEVTRWRVDNFN
jgi:hypothetical protein